MKKFNLPHRWLIHLIAIGVLFLCEFERFFNHGKTLYADAFHDGEFVATLPSVLIGGIDFFTIHGALDWMPAWLAQYMVGTDRHLLLTMFIYHALCVLAGLLLYMIVARHIKPGEKYALSILLATVVLAPYMVSYRDIVLLAAIWLFLQQQSLIESKCKSLSASIVLGLVLAGNVIWSFDRGIAGLAGIGLALLISGIFERRSLLTIGSLLAGMTMLYQLGLLRGNYWENLVFLLNTSSQWSSSFLDMEPALLTLVALLPNILALYLLGKEMGRSFDTNRQEAANAFMLFVLTLCMFKIGTNRADPVHIDMALWVPLLSFIYLSKKINSLDKTLSVQMWILAPPMLVILLYSGVYPLFILPLIPPMLYFLEARNPALGARLANNRTAFLWLLAIVVIAKSVKVSSYFSHGEYAWMSGLFNPPGNALVVDQSINWVSEEILGAHSICVFDLSNSGVINGITGLPSCTQYTYPTYATDQYEADMLLQLQQSSPAVVVISSSSWGKRMNHHFPKLEEYLIKAYPFEKCAYGYCLRYLHQPQEI